MIAIVNEKYLQAFQRFEEDYSLPKFKKANRRSSDEEPMEDSGDSDGDDDSSQPMTSNSKSITPRFMWRDDPEMYMGANPTQPRNRWGQFCKSFVRAISPRVKPVPVQTTFKLIFDTKTQLESFVMKKELIDQVLKAAKTNGQTALYEKLLLERQCRICENALVELGHPRFITEEVLVAIAHKSERGFCLDWIKNFIRVIPPEVVAKKKKLDAALVFDNYLVLHYDPEGKSNRRTQQDIRRDYDPILFGVNRGSRKLYFVGDWVDAQCDLTFEGLIKVAEKYSVSTGETTIPANPAVP